MIVEARKEAAKICNQSGLVSDSDETCSQALNEVSPDILNYSNNNCNMTS